MENVWEYLGANKLSRPVWDSYGAIVIARGVAWNFLVNDPDRIRSIGFRDWACVKVQAGWYNIGQFAGPAITAMATTHFGP